MGNAAGVEIAPEGAADNGQNPLQKQASTKSEEPKRQSVAKGRTNGQVEAEDDGETDDAEMDPVEVLFQFIPYYGQGDPSNDSIVRSTLSALSVEDIDTKDAYGNTLLLMACQYRCEDLVRIMLNKGADPNAVNNSGACGLHFACYRETQSKNISKLLLQNGANPDVAESTYGCTPLHYCAGTGDVAFCKLLLQYGSSVSTYDYYNYTCVDYAREAGMNECAQFLQAKLLQTASQGPGAFSKGGNLFLGKNDFSVPTHQQAVPSSPASSFSSVSPVKRPGAYVSDKAGIPEEDVWEPHMDPQTNSRYYMNAATGECLWENDYQRMKEDEETNRMLQLGEQSSNFISHEDSSNDLLGGLPTTTTAEENKPMKTSGSFFLKDLQAQRTMTRINSGANASGDSAALQLALNEARQKADYDLEQERNKARTIISEKDGAIAKLQASVDALAREKASLEADLADLKKRLEMMQTSGGEAMEQTSETMRQLEAENTKLKADLALANSNYAAESERLHSLQNSLSSLQSGQEERIKEEQRAADERARQQQEREQEHAQNIKELEDRMTDIKKRNVEEIAKMKGEINRTQREAEDRIDVYKKQRDKEIEALNMVLAETKAKFAEELSKAQMIAEGNEKKAKEALTRADEAESSLASAQAAIEEAKQVQQFNAQLHRDLNREQVARKRLHNEIEDMKGRIRVYVRIRPMSESEIGKGCQEGVFKDGKMSVLVKGVGGADGKKVYDFDQVFSGTPAEGNSQADVFRDTKHLMLSVIDGYNVCIFAYGQTGSGKTFTMIGAADIGNCMQPNGEFNDLAGITPRAVSEIFRLLNERTAQCTYEVEVQMFQLYRDGLDDLLAKKKKKGEEEKKAGPLKITLAEHSPTGLVNVEGAEAMIATTPAEVMNIFSIGSARRATASTQMNAESSRSHLICCLKIILTNRRSGTQTVGKLTLVDLAGSERVDKSGATGEMLKEAQSINKSLSAIGDVINALTTNAPHVPYRNHPLTMLMSDSIGGNAKTLMFVNCSPADYNVSESNSSLTFASRCKDVTNATSAAPAVQAAQLKELKKELAKMKKQNKGGGNVGTLARPV